jgi:hypothetical protein
LGDEGDRSAAAGGGGRELEQRGPCEERPGGKRRGREVSRLHGLATDERA